MFAVTQLSHLVINGGLRIEAIGRAAFLLLVVCWAWIYTTWMVDWFDPQSVVVRVVLLGVALASLLMSAAIPTAFDGHAALFASAYVALQVGRNLAGMLLLRRGEPLRPLFELVVQEPWIGRAVLLGLVQRGSERSFYRIGADRASS